MPVQPVAGCCAQLLKNEQPYVSVHAVQHAADLFCAESLK